MTTKEPAISCLMVAWPRKERFEYFKQSLQTYCSQTYRNRELVIVFDQLASSDEKLWLGFLKSLGRADIRWIDAREKLALGALRERTISLADGDVLCQWDDDDLHHPDRLKIQSEALGALKVGAVCLQDVFQFLRGPRELYWSHLVLPGTIMFRREAAVRYPAVPRHEDSEFLLALLDSSSVGVVHGRPYLYVYNCHGFNTFSRRHHQNMARRASVSRSQVLRRKKRLLKELSRLELGPSPLTVMGREGSAFSWIPGH